MATGSLADNIRSELGPIYGVDYDPDTILQLHHDTNGLRSNDEQYAYWDALTVLEGSFSDVILDVLEIGFSAGGYLLDEFGNNLVDENGDQSTDG